jgi:hypothetical protein
MKLNLSALEKEWKMCRVSTRRLLEHKATWRKFQTRPKIIIKWTKYQIENFTEKNIKVKRSPNFILGLYWLMKRLKISINALISCPVCVLTFGWHFVFVAVKGDWLLVLALQTTFNVHYFDFVVLVLVISSLPFLAAIMFFINENTRMSFTSFLKYVRTF